MDDTIYRQETINAMCELMGHWFGTDCEDEKREIKMELDKLPSAQPERKMGHWKRDNTYHGDDTSGFLAPNWRCSECGGQAIINSWFMYDLTNFCPNCGADMRGEEHEL